MAAFRRVLPPWLIHQCWWDPEEIITTSDGSLQMAASSVTLPQRIHLLTHHPGWHRPRPHLTVEVMEVHHITILLVLRLVTKIITILVIVLYHHLLPIIQRPAAVQLNRPQNWPQCPLAQPLLPPVASHRLFRDMVTENPHEPFENSTSPILKLRSSDLIMKVLPNRQHHRRPQLPLQRQQERSLWPRLHNTEVIQDAFQLNKTITFFHIIINKVSIHMIKPEMNKNSVKLQHIRIIHHSTNETVTSNNSSSKGHLRKKGMAAAVILVDGDLLWVHGLLRFEDYELRVVIETVHLTLQDDFNPVIEVGMKKTTFILHQWIRDSVKLLRKH